MHSLSYNVRVKLHAMSFDVRMFSCNVCVELQCTWWVTMYVLRSYKVCRVLMYVLSCYVCDELWNHNMWGCNVCVESLCTYVVCGVAMYSIRWVTKYAVGELQLCGATMCICVYTRICACTMGICVNYEYNVCVELQCMWTYNVCGELHAMYGVTIGMRWVICMRSTMYWIQVTPQWIYVDVTADCARSWCWRN